MVEIPHNDIYGQYAQDYRDGLCPNDISDEFGVYVRGAGALGLHDETLYDQDEDAAGARTNAATGEPIDNSTFTDKDDMLSIGAAIVPDKELMERSIDPGNDVDDNDPAGLWLKSELAKKALRAAQNETDSPRVA